MVLKARAKHKGRTMITQEQEASAIRVHSRPFADTFLNED
jgi:hypothetical protein